MDWTDPDWLLEVEAWIDGHLALARRPRTGPLEQPHARPWSTALRAPTARGPVWFKAMVPALAHEARVTQLVAQRRRDLLPALLAVDGEQGWLLMNDAGDRLRELAGPDPEDVIAHWEHLLPAYAHLQQSVAPFRDILVGAGAPDRRLLLLPRLYQRLMMDEAALRPDHADALAPDEIDDLRALVPHVGDLCRQLMAQGIPETIQHDDLHDGQIFVKDGRYLFLDWGDACVAHPFMTMTVTLNSVAHRLKVARDGPEMVRLRDAYLGAWHVRGDPLLAFELADLLGHAGRALCWHDIVRGLPPAAAAEWADTVPGWLRAFLRAQN